MRSLAGRLDEGVVDQVFGEVLRRVLDPRSACSVPAFDPAYVDRAQPRHVVRFGVRLAQGKNRMLPGRQRRRRLRVHIGPSFGVSDPAGVRPSRSWCRTVATKLGYTWPPSPAS